MTLTAPEDTSAHKHFTRQAVPQQYRVIEAAVYLLDDRIMAASASANNSTVPNSSDSDRNPASLRRRNLLTIWCKDCKAMVFVRYFDRLRRNARGGGKVGDYKKACRRHDKPSDGKAASVTFGDCRLLHCAFRCPKTSTPPAPVSSHGRVR